MSIDKKFSKEQTGAIGESGTQSYYGLTPEGVEKSIRKKLGIVNLKDFVYDIYFKIKSHFVA